MKLYLPWFMDGSGAKQLDFDFFFARCKRVPLGLVSITVRSFKNESDNSEYHGTGIFRNGFL